MREVKKLLRIERKDNYVCVVLIQTPFLKQILGSDLTIRTAEQSRGIIKTSTEIPHR